MRVGVLALQGDFRKHQERLAELGAKPLLVRTERDLASVSALIIPGGESTAFLRLAKPEFRQSLRDAVAGGIPTLATCAGVILLAQTVENPAQESLGVLDVRVQRNAYGRQLDSFITCQVQVAEDAPETLTAAEVQVECVFIRAPRIRETGPAVKVLLRHQAEPILVQQHNILAATFHPELSPSAGARAVHQLLLQMIH